MKILITGGAGFIGSNLAKRLVNDGHNLVVLDSLLRGNKLDKDTFNKLLFIKGDVRDRSLVIEASKGVDMIFHFAAVLGVDIVADNPVETMDVEVIGTRNVVDAAEINNVKRIMYASTSGIYSHSAIVKNALTEEVLVDPRTSYAMAKRYNEIYLASHHEERNLNVISVRFFNVYGSNQDNRMVVPRFFEQAIENKPITVFGNGQQTRDFTYVTDVVRAFLNAAESSATGIALNVGSDKHYSINQLVELLGGKTTYVPKRPGEPDCTFADTTKIHEILGWKPEVSFQDGVAEMLKHLDDWKDAPVWEPDSIKLATASWFEYLGDDK